MDSEKQPGITINQIFLNKAHLEHSVESLALPPNTPVGDHELTVTVSTGFSEDGKQGVATVTVQTTADSAGLYRFVVEMVGLAGIEEGQENIPITEYVSNILPPTMFPFLREAIANLTGRGRFGSVWLKPVNLTQLKPAPTKNE